MSIWAIGLTLSIVASMQQNEPRPVPPRFENQNPIPTLPGVMLDRRLHGIGIANPMARSKGLQGRILWIDATANIERYNTEQKIVELVAKIGDTGFNTIVLDVKPISGHVIFKSEFAPKLMEWRGRKLPEDFDPVPIFCREAKRKKVQVFVSVNAFSEGHNLFRTGPGYERPSWQTVFYEPIVYAEIGFQQLPVALNPNGLVAPTELMVFTNVESLANSSGNGFAVSMDTFGNFVDGFELFANVTKPTIPRNGCVLVGIGEMADRLRSASFAASSVRFVAKPNLIPSGLKPTDQTPLMTNPASKEVWERNASIVRELASKYEIDGMVYDDRMRFAGMNADFGAEFRGLFEDWLGRKLKRWPEDVYQITFSPNFSRGIKPGPDYENWLIFRSVLMRRYVSAIANLLKQIRPSAQFGLYAGSWYGEYAAFGANYGANDLDAGFWFLSPEYRQTGFADQLDFLITGCYYPNPTIFEAMSLGKGVGQSIESAAALTNRVANDSTWTYAGISLEQFAQNPRGLGNALQAACGATQGVMVFDLSHNIDPMWPVFRQAFRSSAKAPHLSSLNLLELRRRKSVEIKAGRRPKTVVVSTGQPGAGH